MHIMHIIERMLKNPKSDVTLEVNLKLIGTT